MYKPHNISSGLLCKTETHGTYMKNDNFGDIAKRLGISKSTVSKASRHCSGVDSDTRHAILGEIRKLNIPSDGCCDIYRIYPDTPSYFWDDIAYPDSHIDSRIKVKSNVITKVGDSSAVLDYIDEAEKMQAKALIITANITPEIEEKLKNLVGRCFIIFLSERCSMVNSFYIGSDPYADGYRMGKIYTEKFADRRLLILSTQTNSNVCERINGFVGALNDIGTAREKYSIASIDDIIKSDMKLYPSKLAALLKESTADDPYADRCVYVPAGTDKYFSAVSKADLLGRITSMCHDIPLTATCGITVVCSQNIAAQSKAAYEAAERYILSGQYSQSKNTFIPSDITVIEE